jgi:hypothetical protein
MLPFFSPAAHISAPNVDAVTPVRLAFAGRAAAQGGATRNKNEVSMQRLSRVSMALALAGAALFQAGAAQAAAGVKVFSNYTTNSFSDQDSGACINGAVVGCQIEVELAAQFFTPNRTNPLDYIDLAITNYGRPLGVMGQGVAIALVPDNGSGTAPDTHAPALEEWTIAKLKYNYVGEVAKVTKVVSKLHPMLTAGKTYWIVLTPSSYDGSVAWNFSGQGAKGVVSLDGGKTWQTAIGASAFDVWEEP